MHRVARPYFTLRFFISFIRVMMIREPEEPTGWPRAMAPPLTLMMSILSSQCSCLMQPSAWAAKASLSSIRPMSSMVRPAFFRALGTAWTGPRPITRGSTPAVPMPMILATGFRPSSLALLSLISSRAEAPSLRPEEEPAVTVPVSSEVPNTRPSASFLMLKQGFSLAIFSSLVVRLGNSSVSKTMGSFLRPWGTTTGTISSLKRPESTAAMALRWESREKASCSSRVMPRVRAMFSAVAPMLYLPYISWGWLRNWPSVRASTRSVLPVPTPQRALRM